MPLLWISFRSRAMCCSGSISPPRCARPAATLLRRHSRSRVSPTRPSSVWMRFCARPGGSSYADDSWSGIRRATRIAPGARTSLPPTGRCGSPQSLPVLRCAYLALSRPAALDVAAPILGLWLASPAIAWWISRPLPRREARLTADQTVFLRMLARKTWAFFETFVGPEDHWLPPDNYQEHPVAAVGHRTSPTNMGLALLANLSAYDFGYIPAGQLIERTEHAFRAMEALERHRGHFYNWYDTLSLKPLPPLYVSTVDSGNLAADLLTLRPGLLTLPDQKILATRLFEGLSDTLQDSRGRCRRSRSGPTRSTSEGSGVRVRFPANHAHGCAALPRPAGDIRCGGGREPRW